MKSKYLETLTSQVGGFDQQPNQAAILQKRINAVMQLIQQQYSQTGDQQMSSFMNLVRNTLSGMRDNFI